MAKKEYMDKKVLPFNWRSELENMPDIDSIGNDLILLDKPVIASAFDYPFKTDVVTAIISIGGTTRGSINLRPYATQSPCLIILLPGQILQYEYTSEDFSGLFVVMSKRFLDVWVFRNGFRCVSPSTMTLISP
ncbi:MAG: hypothetical protein LBQ78_03835 [Tannerellaceae bacterium]|nr:hypothetical protein [Tannerellaceae bacterium]